VAAALRSPGTLSLARALSKFGVCSRSEAARRISAGRVLVNGRTVYDPGTWIDPRRDHVLVDGSAVNDATPRIVLALNKPVGYITSRTDPSGRPTVYDLLGDVGRWVFPVGRLDRDTSGLLILTNDHRLGEHLTIPATHVPKTYHVRVSGILSPETLCVLREGLDIGDPTPTRPASVYLLGARRDGESWMAMTLTEGRNRQVRRMCATVGHDVQALVRVRIGGLDLADLAPGAWRELDRDEIRNLTTLLAIPVAAQDRS
jgi:23S rRNA pseudouridine2605 synthase